MSERLLFQTVDTDTCEEITSDSYLIDVASIEPHDAEVLDECDHYGTLTDAGREIVRRNGVPVADLWEAYRREQRVIVAVGGVFDVCDDGHVRLTAVTA